jgi:hypothetical protein
MHCGVTAKRRTPQFHPMYPLRDFRELSITHLLGLPFLSMFTWKP